MMPQAEIRKLERLLQAHLEPVAARQRKWRLQKQLALCWGIAALVGFCLVLVGVRSTWLIVALAGGSAFASVVIWKRLHNWQPDFRYIARQIEQRHPELHALLLTAVEQQPEEATGQLNYFQERAIQEAVSQNQERQWVETIPRRQLLALEWGQFIALVALVVALFGLRVPTLKSSPGSVAAAQEGPTVTVTPGDTAVERGSALVVLARFAGPLPPGADLVMTTGAGTSHSSPLVKNLDDPVFGGSIPEVTNDFSYRIEYASQQTREFKVTVFEYPRLERADAHIHFPGYTGMADKEIKDTHRVSAVEGSTLDLALQLNKPVASAKLVSKDQAVIPLLIETNKPLVNLKGFPLQASKTYALQLVDADGRTNKVPAQFVLDALKNHAPELKLAAPRGDQRVSPLEEMTFQGEAWDDFGLQAYGLAFTVAGQETKFVELGQATNANQKQSFNYLLKLEDLAVKPDQLISYYLWADDVGPTGNVRRTASDMYFAEIRPFEEIFREGQSPDGQGEGQQGGQQGGGNQALKLAELQKQIINATWKLQRQAASGTVPPAESSTEPNTPPKARMRIR